MANLIYPQAPILITTRTRGQLKLTGKLLTLTGSTYLTEEGLTYNTYGIPIPEISTETDYTQIFPNSPTLSELVKDIIENISEQSPTEANYLRDELKCLLRGLTNIFNIEYNENLLELITGVLIA